MKGLFFLLTFIVGLFFIAPSIFAANARDDLQHANQWVEESLQMAQKGDMKGVEEKFRIFNSKWVEIEDGIKRESNQAYRGIEDLMGQVQFDFAGQSVNKEKLITDLTHLEQMNEKFINGAFKSDVVQGNIVKTEGDVKGLLSVLDLALVHIRQNNIQGAIKDMEQFRSLWLNVEGKVVTQSSSVYKETEKDMVVSYAQLTANPINVVGAEQTIQGMRNYLAPLAAKTSYSMLDATTILLREGLEALLIVVALLAFLKKTGYESKKKWVWMGVGSGVAFSVILGVLVQFLFSSGSFGNNNFLITGYTGIFAAVMLLYMSYWLHSKSSISQWNGFIENKSSRALATGSLWPLALLSFLAVFREGTETVLFFIGMASSIKITSLLIGISVGILLLIMISYLMIKVGLKIPIRPFFLVSSLLVFYLCFKFTGMGIHGLQLAGLVPSTEVKGIPSIDFLAVYSTWESIIPQTFLLMAAIVIPIWNKRKGRFLKNPLKMTKGEI